MACTEPQKVAFAMYILEANTEYWWTSAKRQSLEEKVAEKERWKRKGHEKVYEEVKRKNGKGNECEKDMGNER